MFAMIVQNAGVLFLMFLPFVASQFVALLLLPGLLKNGAQIHGVAKAAYCYTAQSFGIMLMAIAALPTVYAVIGGQSQPNQFFTALLFIFAFGGLVFLWHDWLASGIDSTSKQVPFLIHFYSWKLIGLLLFSLAVLSLILQVTFLVNEASDRIDWTTHFTAIIGGFTLLWCTWLPREKPTMKKAVQMNMTVRPVGRKTKKLTTSVA